MKQCEKCLQTKPLSEFKLVSPKRVPMKFCIDCYTENRRYYRETGTSPCKKDEALKRNYGITLNEYNEMLESQENRCAICQGDNPKGAKRANTFVVDHCHTTGKVRGLLCHACNRALGNFGDSIENLERAILYLKNQ
jgi:hypothetical protein